MPEFDFQRVLHCVLTGVSNLRSLRWTRKISFLIRVFFFFELDFLTSTDTFCLHSGLFLRKDGRALMNKITDGIYSIDKDMCLIGNIPYLDLIWDTNFRNQACCEALPVRYVVWRAQGRPKTPVLLQTATVTPNIVKIWAWYVIYRTQTSSGAQNFTFRPVVKLY